MTDETTPPEADASVPGDAPVDVVADPVVTPDATTADSATADPVVVTAPDPDPSTDAPAAPTPEEDAQAAVAAAVPAPDAPADDAVPVVDLSNPTAPVVDTVSVSDPEPSPPISESATDPTADPITPVVAEATPDTPPSLSEDAYAQNLAANVAGASAAPADPVVPADFDARYAVRTEDQLASLETASAQLLDAVRACAVAGLTRGQLADTCTLAIEQLYVERRDAAVTGADDPYPSF